MILKIIVMQGNSIVFESSRSSNVEYHELSVVTCGLNPIYF